jgi:prepilin-type N-terminal cleavage/methylation domain-containing protein
MHTSHPRRTGFTLIEMVVVITIMSIVVGAAIPITSKALTYHARKATRGELQGLSDACAEYFRDTLAKPASVTDLLVDPTVTGWSGPYLPGVAADSLTGKVGYLVDAWSRDYRIVVSGDVISIQSQGEDAAWGTSQDLTVDLDVTPLRRVETLDRLGIINPAVKRYNTEKSDIDPPLPASWASARSILIANGYLPNDSRYQTDAWGSNLIEDPAGMTPVVRVKSVNVQ